MNHEKKPGNPKFVVNVISGNYSRNFMQFFMIPGLIIGYFGALLIAARTFPEYSISTHYISNMGNPYLNPAGWIIWSIGHLIKGLFMVVLVGYGYTRLEKVVDKPILAQARALSLGRILLYISAIGWMFMCFFPQYHGVFWEIMHAINAVMLLGGYYLGLFFWGAIGVHSHAILNKNWLKLHILFALVGPIGIIISQIFALMSGFSLNETAGSDAYWIFNIAFWEWMLMFGAIASFFAFLLALPERLDPHKI
jgi:hypothetical protein